jgi:hypothetical protein
MLLFDAAIDACSMRDISSRCISHAFRCCRHLDAAALLAERYCSRAFAGGRRVTENDAFSFRFLLTLGAVIRPELLAGSALILAADGLSVIFKEAVLGGMLLA